MKNENLLLGSKFAKKFNKQYGIITYSGTLAIEVALQSLKLKHNAKILISSNVCYSIVNTIIKLNMIPVIKAPQNSLFLTDTDVIEVLKNENIDCILLVHQYGLFNSIDALKYKNKGIKIIEDVAQAWNINNVQNYNIGENSDVVVTSFGKTKPISYGIGGGLFFDDNSFLENVDFCDAISREKNGMLLSYAYPLCEEMDYNVLELLADKIVEEQRNSANKYSKILRGQKKIKYLDSDLYCGNVWHRFPIWIEDNKLYKRIIKFLETSELEYQLPHKLELIDLPSCENCVKISNKRCVTNQILLRTRNIDIENQLSKLKMLKLTSGNLSKFML